MFEIFNKNLSVPELGPVSLIRGMEITRDAERGTLKLSQHRCVISLLQKNDMESCNSVHMPGITNSTLPATEEHLLDLQGIKQYQARVGSLIFLSQGTRFVIAFSVTQVSRYMSRPTTEHLTAAKRIFRHLR
ncbi:unnamed protein product, partial [Sphacelaria rigidula]